MKDLACLNGETMPVEQARVPVWDRGFLFGDAVYEVFRMYRGRRAPLPVVCPFPGTVENSIL